MRRLNQMNPMTTRNTVYPQDSRAAGDLSSEDSRRHLRRPIGTRIAANPLTAGKGRKPVEPAAVVGSSDSKPQPKEDTRQSECIFYRGYELKVQPQRNGWKVAIFPQGSPFALHRIPCTSEDSKRAAIIAEAKAIVDAELPAQIAPEVDSAPPDAPKQDDEPQVAVSVRTRHTVSRAWSTVKRIYFSVDQTPRSK